MNKNAKREWEIQRRCRDGTLYKHYTVGGPRIGVSEIGRNILVCKKRKKKSSSQLDVRCTLEAS
jgi:hypothetical protein